MNTQLQFDHAVMEKDSDDSKRVVARDRRWRQAGRRRITGKRVAHQNLGLDILRERLDVLNERSGLVGTRGFELFLGAEFRRIAREQIRYLDDRSFVGPPGGDRECFHDRLK